jgi:CubicO group peptidase (beta-lactamase class C family)
LRTEYSNISYLSLGLLVEQESGRSLVDYLHRRVLTPAMWVPATELQVGRTFRADQDPREPNYYSTSTGDNIYDNSEPYEQVATPYGTWPQTGLAGYGSFIASAPAILAFLDRYHTGVYDPRIGEPISTSNPLTGREGHNGILTGTNSYMAQRTDDVNVFIVFNKRGESHFATGFYSDHLEPLLDAVTTWPTDTSDGFWVSTAGTGSSGTGGYNDVFASVGAAVSYAQDGSKLRLNPGTSMWTGVLETQLLIDAPRGSASLGN